MIKRKKDGKKKSSSVKLKKALRVYSAKKLREEYLTLPPVRSLPWCLNPGEGNAPDYPGSSSDFIINNLVAEFKLCSGQKISELLRCIVQEENTSLLEIFLQNNNKHFHQILESFVSISKKTSLSFSLHALLQWRAYEYQKKATKKGKSTSIKQTTNTNSKDVQNPIQEEMHTLAIEYILGYTILSLFKDSTDNSLQELDLQHVLDLSMENCRNNSKPTPPVVENKRAVFNIFSKVLGTLSQIHFLNVSEAIWSEVPSWIAHKSKTQNAVVLAHMECLKDIYLDVQSAFGLQNTHTFLMQSFAKTLKYSKLSKDVRAEISSSTVCMLRRVALQPFNPELEGEYKELVKGFFTSTYNLFASAKRKQKEPAQQIYPLLSALLSCTDEKFFLENWMSLCQSMQPLLAKKNVRSIILDSIKLLMETYESKFAKNDPDLSSSLDSLAAIIFFPHKNSKATYAFQGEPVSNLELLIDITFLFSKLNLDFAMTKICFVFFREDILGVSQPEKLFIALRAVFDIHDYFSTPPHDPSITMEQFLPSICDFFSKLLRSLDGMFGNWLLFNQSRTISELIQREKLNSTAFELFRCCISHIPPVIPSGINEAELVSILTRLLIHIDVDIRERAWAILSSLMKQMDVFRPIIVNGMTKYLLSIPDMKPTIIRGVMSKLLKMINFWIFIRSQGASNSKQGSISRVISFEIEGIALLYLCNPNAEVRDLALEIMMGIRRISLHDDEHSRETTKIEREPIRMIDIIEQSGKDIIEEMKNDFAFCCEVPFPTDLQIVSIKTLAVSKHTMCWAYCLSELVVLAQEICPQVINSIRPTFVLRVEEIAKSPIPVEKGILSLWRNYLTATCIISDESTGAKELFSLISPFLRQETHHEAIIFALKRGNIKVISEVFEMDTAGKKSKKRDKLRIDFGSILASQSARFPPCFLEREQRVKEYAIQYIMEYLSNTNPVDEQSIGTRNYFCMVVCNIATHLYSTGDKKLVLSKDLRLRLFKVFSRWSENSLRIDSGYSDATVKKRKLAHPSGTTMAPSHSIFLKMQELSCSAVASILQGPSFTPVPFTKQDPVLVWIQEMAMSDRENIQNISVHALTFYLQSNSEPSLISIALDRCYSRDKEDPVANTYFLAIVETYKYAISFPSISHAVLLHLILYKLGDPSSIIRTSAIEFLHILAEQRQGEGDDAWARTYSPSGIDSSIFEIYQRAQLDLSSRLAKNNTALTIELFEEFIYRITSTTILQQKLMLQYIITWIQTMKLEMLEHVTLSDVIKKLFWITMIYIKKSRHFDLLAEIWETLASSSPSNIPLIIDCALSIGVNKRNVAFIDLAKRMVFFLTRSDHKTAIDTLVSELSTITPILAVRNLSPLASSDYSDRPGSSLFDKEMPNCKGYQPPARGHLALLLLTELSFLPPLANELSSHLPILLQQVFLGADHSNCIVHDHCRILLENLVSLLVIVPEESKPNWEENELLVYARQLIEFLKSKKNIQFWAREDVCHEQQRVGSADQICSLVVRVIDVLISRFPHLREAWGTEAFTWATNCPDYHWGCRSFQMYRAINPETNPESLNTIITVLIKLLHSEHNECGMELEILYTLQVIALTANTNRLVLFNQLFWCATALLNCDYEIVYVQAIRVLSIILERVSFLDKAVQHVFEASRPNEWPSSVPGIQPLLLRGLLSSTSEEFVVDVLIKISPLPLDDIFHPDPTRLVISILSLQPWICANFSDKKQRRFVQKAAAHLSKACNNAGKNELAMLYSKLSFSSSTGEGVGSFITNWCKFFASTFLPEYAFVTFSMLSEFLHDGHSQYYRFVLRLIQYLVPHVKWNLKEFKRRIPLWFGLVSQLVLSEIWQEALLVLESATGNTSMESDVFDMEKLRPFRSSGKEPNFSNEMGGEGNFCAVECLKRVISFESKEKMEKLGPKNIISPRAFAKFFSEDDMKQRKEEEPQDNNDQEEDAESEELGESEDFSGMEQFDQGSGGHMSFGMDPFGNSDLACFDDLLADLDGEGEVDLDSSFEV